ncbi:MAG: serine/threonine protein kinase, partial [Planctomycetes bacterium]|nr:serine/threonine protein kinase [Planctomycetota bacterium]
MTAEPSRFDRLLRHAFAADAGEPAGAGVADGPDRPELPVRYVVLGEIAHGGMGLVLRARDTVLGREVAVKVLRARHRGRGNLTARFVAEAQITGQLQHPGVPALHEVGICPDQRPWFSMRLVSGRTLAGRLAERADPSIGVAGLLAVALAIARTVAYAHARGVVHRDLKPSNIMVGAFGEVQVMDWGMAKVLGEGGNADELRAREAWQPIATTRSSDAGSATLAGSIFGTPAYMPPEQARGEIDRIDRRGDVFAIGAILCEMLIGRPPYSGTDDEIVGQARAGAVEPALEEVGRRGVAADLVSLVRDCLRPDRDERPVDCGAVAERLAAHLDAVEADRRRAEARAFAERRTRRLTALVAAVVVAALATAFASWRAVDIERSRREQEGR